MLYFIQGGFDGVRSGSQECSTKKKVSVLIINSLSSIHCTGAGHARGTCEGKGAPLLFSPRASSRFRP